MEYDEAMNQYGSDRPDLRFGMQLHDITDLGQQTDFGVFKNAAMVKAIVVPGGGKLSRKETDALAEWAKGFGAKGLAVTKVTASRPRTPASPNSSRPIAAKLIERTGAKEGDLLCLRRRQAQDRPQGSRRTAAEDGPRSETAAIHRIRLGLGRRISRCLNMTRRKSVSPARIIRSPPPLDGDLAKLDSRDQATSSNRSRARPTTSSSTAAKSAADRSVSTAWTCSRKSSRCWASTTPPRKPKFGFLLDALQYGAPPHGGIALGLDRLVMILRGITNIRDVIAFPKTQSGADLMCGSPSPIDEKQLREANIRVVQRRRSPKRRKADASSRTAMTNVNRSAGRVPSASDSAYSSKERGWHETITKEVFPYRPHLYPDGVSTYDRSRPDRDTCT